MDDKVDPNPRQGDSEQDPPHEGSESIESLKDSLTKVQSEVASLEQRRRDLQGSADRERARADALEGKLSEVEDLKAQIEELKGQLSAVPSVDAIAAAVAQQQKATDFRADLANRYPGVDLEQVTGATFEELEASAKGLHEAREASLAQLKEEARTAALAELKKQFPDFEANFHADDQGDGGAADAGAMTLEKFLEADATELADMPDDEFKKWASEAHAQGIF